MGEATDKPVLSQCAAKKKTPQGRVTIEENGSMYTVCDAGWVVTLADPADRALKWTLGTPLAAGLIYMRSDPHLESIPRLLRR